MDLVIFLNNIFKQLTKGNLKPISNVRYYKRWKKYKHRNSIADELPWLTFRAIDFLKDNLPRDAKIFEWGGGGSTLFFIPRASELVTAEHDKEWFERLSAIVKERHIQTWNGKLFGPEPVEKNQQQLSLSDPSHYYSSIDKTFKQYVTFIDQFPDEYFDLILVDGRARASCVEHSFSKLKTGGLLVLDNAERKYYTEAHKRTLTSAYKLLVNTFGPIPFTEGFSQTNIWRKLS